MSAPAYTIAALAACHNRKEKTLGFLRSLVAQSVFSVHKINIYLLDDASADGTAAAVQEEFPEVTIVRGTGSLFWAGGMRTVWEYAMRQKPYDLYCLFNDDVMLFNKALENLLEQYRLLPQKGAVLIGSTADPATGKVSYGGVIYKEHAFRVTEFTVIKPHAANALPCTFAHANIMLVDKATINRVGIFSARYIHTFADFDYTHTAWKAGLQVLVAPGYYGYCTNDHGSNWLPAGTPLKERIRYLYSPRGLSYKEYLFFISRHFPHSYISVAVKLWMKTLFPLIWDHYKKAGN